MFKNKIFAAMAVCALISPQLHAAREVGPPEAGKTSPTYKDEGNVRESYTLVGSSNASTLNPWVNHPKGSPNHVNVRAITIQNQDSTFKLCFATYSVFNATITHNASANAGNFSWVGAGNTVTLYSDTTWYARWEDNVSSRAFNCSREYQR